MFARAEGLSIGTLRARGAPRDDIAFRQALTRVLDNADLQPAGVPPSAILIVRRMTKSLPGANDLRGLGHVAWERALRSRLEALYRSAAHPGRDAIPGDCNAVVFANRTELLACLIRDLMRGVAGQQWWWLAILARWPAGTAPSKAVVALLVEEPAQLPAVIAQLHATGDSVRVLGTIDPGDAAVLARALASCFGLAVVADELSRATVGLLSRGEFTPAGFKPVSARQAPFHAIRPRQEHDQQAVPGCPTRSVPERRAQSARDEATVEPPSSLDDLLFAEVRRAHLTHERQLLLGLALALARRPWAVRKNAFQREALHQWWHAAHAPGESGTAARTLDRRSPARQSAAVAKKSAGLPPGPAVANPEAGCARSERRGRPGREPSLSAAGPRPGRATAGAPLAREALRTGNLEVRKPKIATTVATTTPPGSADAFRGPAPVPPATSEFAGVLYLLNLMTALDLPECFEPDWRLASRLGPWALLDTLGRALLEVAAIDASADPLWPWLAALDGRAPAEPLGQELVVPPAYRLPVAWLGSGGMPDDTCHVAQVAGRLRLWSAGFLIAEVPRDARPAGAQAAVELDRYLPGLERMQLQRASWGATPLARLRLPAARPALRRLFTCMMPFLQFRLALALGQQAIEPGTIAALLRCRARLYASPTHIDLVASLDAISLPARFAGLDRDPGWQPSLGRVVSFHFE